MRLRARFSSPAPPCNGCATVCTIVQSAEETGALAAAADPTQEVYLVPAFVGLGAPYWRPDARGALFGLTRATGPRELAQAALESVCFQTVDLLTAMKADWRRADEALEDFAGRRRNGGFRLDHAAARRSRPAARSTGRASRKRRCLARPISPACMPAFFRSRIALRASGNPSDVSRRRWTRPRGNENWPDGPRPSARCWRNARVDVSTATRNEEPSLRPDGSSDLRV